MYNNFDRVKFFFKAGKIDFKNYLSESLILTVMIFPTRLFKKNAIPNIGLITSFLKINNNKVENFH